MQAEARPSQIPVDAVAREFGKADPNCVAILDLGGFVLHANAAARAEGLGVPDASVGTDWAAWWPLEARPLARLAIEAARLQGIGQMEGARPGSAGGPRTWAASVTLSLGEDGSPSHLLAVCRDVTKQRERDATHDSTRRRMDALVAAVGEIVWQSDAHQLNGIRRDKRSSRPSARAATHKWLDALHPDDRSGCEERARHGIATGTAYVNEYRLPDRDGAWRWVEDSAVPIMGDEGRVAEWIGVVSDIHARKTAEKALRESEERLRLAVAASGIGVWEADLATGAREWSPQLKAIFGVAPDEPGSEALLFSLVHPEDHGVVKLTHADPHKQESASPGVIYRIIRPNDGKIRWIASYSRAVLDDAGHPTRLLGTVQDITERKREESERTDRAWYLREALRRGRMMIWERDGATGMITRSEGAEEIVGNTREHHSEFFKRVHTEDRAKLVWNPGSVPPSASVQFRYCHPDGRNLWLETTAIQVRATDGPGSGFGITTDITAKKLWEERLVHAASHDPLTGLLNRMAFGEKLEDAMATGAAQGTGLNLLLIDVDDLKGVNDSLGHDAGDAILKLTAEKLAGTKPPLSIVGRLSGDEFAAVLPGDHTPDEAKDFCERLSALFADAVPYKQGSIAVGASVGVAAFPEHGTTPRDLLKNADLALYSAKRAGRGRSQIFRPAMRAAVEAVSSLKAEFREALAARQIVPFYQPKVDLATGAVVGFEALARWIHPERGLLTPAVFGAVFDDGNLALEIGALMLDHLLRDIRRWLDLDLPVGRIALNCTTHEFRLGDFAEVVLQTLQEAGAPTQHLEIEVTEGVILGRDSGAVAGILRRLQQGGVKISLDDFGTGYASLVHLKTFPVDEIKIDRSFVWEIDDPTNLAIVKAVVAMGRSLDLTIVAEGIETAAQAQALLAIGCDQGQGYWFAKPMPAEGVAPFLQKNAESLERPTGLLRSIVAV